jgi:hypothetical protein
MALRKLKIGNALPIPRRDRLVADGYLTAWPVNVRDTLYVVTNRECKAG